MEPQKVTFPCDDITLQGIWHVPEGTGPFPAVVVCHPHPLYGGDMTNNVVVAICEALLHSSIAVLRFNFRGVGQSRGSFGGGIAEQEDLRAALQYIRSSPDVDSRKIGLAGYSFGAAMVLSAALGDEEMHYLALVSPMTSDATFEQLQRFDGSKLVIIGESDTMLPVSWYQHYSGEGSGILQCDVVPGADHFWFGHEGEITSRVSRFFISAFNKV